MPLYVQTILTWLRQRLLVVLGFVVLVVVILFGVLPSKSSAPSVPVKRAQGLPPVSPHEMPLVQKTLAVEDQMHQLAGVVKGLEATVRQTQQSQRATEEHRQTQVEAQLKQQAQQFETLLQRLQQSVQQHQKVAVASPVKTPSTEKRPESPARPSLVPPGATPARTADTEECAGRPHCIRVLRPKPGVAAQTAPPSATRGETPYLQVGSFAEAKVLTGVMASSRAGGALPILFSVSSEFHPPYQIRGPGVSPLATAMAIQGCFVFGKAQGDLEMGRAMVQLDILSCVFPDGAAFEAPIKGYATGSDGTLGIVGRIESHETAVLFKTFLTSILAGTSTVGFSAVDAAFKRFNTTVILQPLGATSSGQSSAPGEAVSQRLVDFYLKQVSQSLPVIWVESGAPAKLVLSEGVALEGLPTTTTIQAGY